MNGQRVASEEECDEDVLEGSDCSVQSNCSPPSRFAASAEVKFAKGSKEYAC